MTIGSALVTAGNRTDLTLKRKEFCQVFQRNAADAPREVWLSLSFAERLAQKR